MKLAIDTNRYTDFCDGDAQTVGVIRSADEIWVPLIVVGELRCGFAHGGRREQNEAILSRFLASPRARVLAVDLETTTRYAEIYAALRRRGRALAANDLWIAALAVQHDLLLFTRDSDFDDVPGLKRI